MQKVNLGLTCSKRLGYFTNGFLAWGLNPEDINKPYEWHKQYAESLGFAVEDEFSFNSDRNWVLAWVRLNKLSNM